MMNWNSEKRGDFGFMKHRNYPRMTWNCFVYESLARGRRWARLCPFSTATRLGRPKHIAFTLSLQVKRVFDDEGWFHPDFKVFILYDPSILYSKFLQNPSFQIEGWGQLLQFKASVSFLSQNRFQHFPETCCWNASWDAFSHWLYW